ncbi:ABC transporter substrate-binding protein [Nocardioides sp.]|uniref:ABC transporter substrate-binding protein n=1 Tax=Nocardioides sp. TaxID=35761 RepID=UPI00356ADE47
MLLGVGLLSLVLTATGCQAERSPTPDPSPTSPTSAKPSVLTFGVFGPPEEIEAVQSVVDQYNAAAVGSEISLRSWPDRAGLMAEVELGAEVPDVFMASRRDLAQLREERLLRPVDDLLDARGVDFGDGYSRDGMEAFSVDNRLQCMPYGISPMVIYYNRDLVDFERMRARGLNAPELVDGSDVRWSFDQFAAAARFATRPAKGTRGLYIEPTLRGLAPFVYSGDGTLFDSEAEPTSLAFSEDDSRAALERTLELLRDPHVNLTDRQLARATPQEWFERGRVGMIAGFRGLVPELRQVQGLNWDVMPMPSLESPATIGDITGLCLSSGSADISRAADFLVHATSAPAVSTVTRVGYLAPANLEVALSDDFLQPGRQPQHSRVFNASVRSMETPPLIFAWDELEDAVAGALRRLVSVPVLDLDALTEQIDRISQRVLIPADPESTPDS